MYYHFLNYYAKISGPKIFKEKGIFCFSVLKYSPLGWDRHGSRKL